MPSQSKINKFHNFPYYCYDLMYDAVKKCLLVVVLISKSIILLRCFDSENMSRRLLRRFPNNFLQSYKCLFVSIGEK